MIKKRIALIIAMLVIAASLCVFVACDDSGKTDVGIELASGSGGSIDGDVLSLEVGTTVEKIDLNYVISVANGAAFTVSEDEDGKLIVPDKIVELSKGENNFYVTVQNGKNKKVYDLNIWKNFKTTVYYCVNGEVFDKQEDVLSHTYLTDFRAPTDLKYGMKFLGWDCEGYYVEEQNKVFNAKLQYKEVTVDLDADGGQCLAKKAKLYVGTGFILPVPTKHGYSFRGWLYNGSYVTTSEGESLRQWVDETSAQFKAVWSPNVYIVSFKSNLQGVGKEYNKTCYFGESYTVTYEVNKPGYRFLGWYKDGEKISNEVKLTFNAESDMTIEMRFEYDIVLDNLDYEYDYGKLKITGVKDKSVTSLTIPQGVEIIKEGLLADCKNLQELTLPFIGTKSVSYGDENLFGSLFGSVKRDGYISVSQQYDHGYSFSNYTYIPASLKKVTVWGGQIHEGAFENCVMLTDIVCYVDAKTVGRYAFAGCTSLESVTLNSVKQIGENAFYGCTALKDISPLQFVEFVGKNAFANTSWYAPQEDGPVYVGKVLYKYKGVPAAEEIISVKTDTVSISSEAFYGCCENGTTITVNIPESCLKIGKNAFGGSGNFKIFCEASIKPNDWDGDWRDTDKSQVVWGMLWFNAPVNEE